MSDPMQVLIETIDRLAQGDMSVRTRLAAGPAEITGLARALDGMAASLQARWQALP